MTLERLETASPRSTTNRLLRAIPREELNPLLTVCERVPIRPRQVLHHWLMPVHYVYFIEKGLVSVAAKISSERFVEVWLIGSEGMVGTPIVLGDDDEQPHRRVVQVGGTALLASISDFRSKLRELPQLRTVLYRYVQMILLQTSQSGACNAHHEIRQRLARWLLFTRESLCSDAIPLTQDVLSRLLGVRRATISECLCQFEAEHMVATRRGVILIHDPRKLEETSCDCLRLIMREYQRYLRVGA